MFKNRRDFHVYCEVEDCLIVLSMCDHSRREYIAAPLLPCRRLKLTVLGQV